MVYSLHIKISLIQALKLLCKKTKPFMKTHPFFGVQIFIVYGSIHVVKAYLSGLPPRPFA